MKSLLKTFSPDAIRIDSIVGNCKVDHGYVRWIISAARTYVLN